MSASARAPVVLVTGATSGLGRGLAHGLAERGATVLVHGRDRGRTEALVAELRDAPAEDPARGYVADLASLADVRRLADDLEAREDRLDVLVNNAGVGGIPRQESADGHELHLAVNHLAHFALTVRLLGLLRRSRPARIVNVTSAAQQPLDFGDPSFERGYDPFAAYARSKLAQILFTVELAERLRAEGEGGVSVTALHPATLMDTRMVRESFGAPMSEVGEGVAATLRLVLSSEADGVTGRYFDGGREAAPHRQARDPEARRRLWELSEKLTGLRAG
jgi:NAD(P)-dependent dehydrogenase (short-subunit alcohol dehydrogenase family)